MSQSVPYDMQCKLLMIGDSGVGKTCLLLRYANDSFSPTFITTIGIDFKIKNVEVDGKRIKLQIWDTAGQERYRSLAPMYYRGAAAAIIVYDITNPDSFAGAKSWVKELQRRGDQNVVIAMAGNKADLESRRKVDFNEANEYAEENGILHMETSAKNSNNVKDLFVEIAKSLPKATQQPDREAFPIMPQKPESRNCC
mmetsp:Transcript_16898/g.21858  ORF Transcript_16898/g.21858 Transcript_16898/m.21858 type:complete len:197 (+) Transcript_16898:100-690(+)